MYTIYNKDGSKRTEWTTKANAISAGREFKKMGFEIYVINKVGEIIWSNIKDWGE